ncbi:hypothetical protein SHKM778_89430 [Streptomyces sp. KM77-8]|uniref:Uncharacterized protein n=1 Tax=Streptomyces haneummycinicus TaxID=3074435 RepID=A0AAT9HY20_9ACTN
MHEHRVRVDPGADERGDPLGAQHLLKDRPVGAGEDEPVRRVLDQAEPAVAVHGVGDVDEQRVRHRVAAVLHQRVDDLLSVVSGRPRVPQAEQGHPVGVDVLGRPLQLGERRDDTTAVVGLLVIDLEKQSLVGLDDERTIHARLPFCDGLGTALHGQTSSLPDRARQWSRAGGAASARAA